MNITKVEFRFIIDLSLKSWRKFKLQENWQVSFACEFEVSWILCFTQTEAIQRLQVQWLLIYWIILLILTIASLHEASIQQIERLRITTGRMRIALILSSQFVKVHERNFSLIEMENWTISRLDLITSWSSNMKWIQWLSQIHLKRLWMNTDSQEMVEQCKLTQTQALKVLIERKQNTSQIQKSTLQTHRINIEINISQKTRIQRRKCPSFWIQNIRSRISNLETLSQFWMLLSRFPIRQSIKSHINQMSAGSKSTKKIHCGVWLNSFYLISEIKNGLYLI